MILCEWCESESAVTSKTTVYWELPDGTRAIEITDTPGVQCKECGMVYQEEDTIIQLEDQLLLIDTDQVAKSISYQKLMEIPRRLKRNYFRYDEL
ncbi:YokU family protein [Thalassobacillus sp. C254]|uniref:YokU family protein n=1 Tax=Thalassobacillus sp. C254 TaxID=1225341 RepID=UPI0006D16F66|nr:YokU family protein [Thalassobacillus sp. C254]